MDSRAYVGNINNVLITREMLNINEIYEKEMQMNNNKKKYDFWSILVRLVMWIFAWGLSAYVIRGLCHPFQAMMSLFLAIGNLATSGNPLAGGYKYRAVWPRNQILADSLPINSRCLAYANECSNDVLMLLLILLILFYCYRIVL